MINRKAIIFLFLLIIAFATVLTLQRLSNKGKEDPVSVLRVGDLAPNVNFKTLDGESLSLDNLKGKVVLVNFWATWCPPCIDEIPSLNKTYKELKYSGFEILGFTIDANGKKIIPNFVRTHNVNYPVILDVDQKYARSFSVYGVPENILINKEGVIVSKKYGAYDWTDPKIRKEIEDLLAEEY